MSKLGHLIQILINLQYKNIVTASELSEILQVDKKTIYRYINNLNSANIPIHTLKGRHGGFYIDENLYMKPPKLTVEELQSLDAIQHLCKESNLPFRNYLNNAITKIKHSCIGEDEELKKLFDCNNLNFDELGNKINMDEKIRLINESIDKSKSIKIEYFSLGKNDIVEEIVDAYTLLFRNNKWFLIGYSQLCNRVKDYIIEKITDVELTDYVYIKPKYFSLKKYLWENFENFDEDNILVKIKFLKSCSKYIKSSRWCSEQNIEEMNDGNIIVTINTKGTKCLKKWILSFGESAEVLEPESLKEEIILELKNLSKIYKIN